MVEAADLWSGHDRAADWWRDRPRVGRILRQRQMCPRLVLVRQVQRHDAGQPDFIHDDHMVETFASDGADDSLGVGVLPRRTRGGVDLLDAMPFAVAASAANAWSRSCMR